MKPRVLLIGWDAADWKAIQPLLQSGQMPHLASLIAGGVHGNLSTIYPALSPMLWTSIATGKRPYKHGIHGFSEPLPDGSGVRPISLLSRKTKAVWNILNQNGHRSIVVGWWPSHPAEPLNGVMVSNHFQMPAGTPDSAPPLAPGTVHPASLASSLAGLRVNPMELTGEFLRLFVPEYDKVNQEKDKRLHSLARIIAETMSIHSVATELLETQPWDFAAVYYSAIDHFGHAFMRYHPPRLPWVTEEDFGIYRDVIANGYRYHDAMLGALLSLAGKDTTVILMSDHGFHPDHLRPGYIPAEPAGPAVEHRHYGIVCMKGPGLRAGERIFGAGLLDICPTILTLFGLSPARDMDGKVLLTAFKQPPPVQPIESWDDVPGDAGTHPAETMLDPAASAAAFKQLVDLGYVAPPAGDAQQTVDESVRELKYNLARAYRDGNCCGDAAALAEELWLRWPKEHRFGILLIECLGPLRELERRRAAIEELARRIEHYQAEAKQTLEAKDKSKVGGQKAEDTEATAPNAPGSPTETKAADAPPSPRREGQGEGHRDVRPPEAVTIKGRGETNVSVPPPEEIHTQADPKKQRARFEEHQLRELAHGRPLLVDWLWITQALLEKDQAEARRRLEKLTTADDASNVLSERLGGALTQLGELDNARALLEQALEWDPENALVHAQLAGIHLEVGRYDESLAAATESLSLLYFQPAVHALLGQALLETGRFDQAEKALLVAVAQSPRNLAAHDLLARLYRDHLARPNDAFAHEGRARSLRNELAARTGQRTQRGEIRNSDDAPPKSSSSSSPERSQVPPPFGPEVTRSQIITIVSGLPRSGTSMMMQLLVAAGLPALTDGERAPDEDNPLGYFEFRKATSLAQDSSWLPEARGKVVKIVAQLLLSLPPGEHYEIILMERNLSEVVGSQRAMLARQGRAGAALDERQLIETYRVQLERIRRQLARRPDVRLLQVDYGELLAAPAAGVGRLARFIREPFNQEAAVGSIRPDLRRRK